MRRNKESTAENTLNVALDGSMVSVQDAEKLSKAVYANPDFHNHYDREAGSRTVALSSNCHH